MKTLMTNLGALIKWLWRGLNFLRNVVMNIVFFVFVLLALSVFTLVSGLREPVVLEGDQGALVLDLQGYIQDNREQSDWGTAFQSLNGYYAPRAYSVFDVVYAIEQAAKDERIRGLVLALNEFEGADMPAIRYIGNAILYFKSQNKPVIAYAAHYGQSQYLLASYADKIYVNTAGDVDIHGFAVQNLYFKSLLDNLAVTPHVFRVGTYKAAVEPFLRDDMSPEARRNMEQWLMPMWQTYQQQIADNRQIPLEQVLPPANRYLAELKTLNGDLGAYSLQRGLVDERVVSADLEERLRQLFGEDATRGFKSVDYDTYLAALPDRLSAPKNSGKIAVINVEGTIIDGESLDGNSGGDTIVNLLHEAGDDEAVKGVILRVNSPGGSAFASELIRQGLDELKAKGLPVVVSMGEMAASGGYWIAANADYIIADPNTLTGSIGIFALLPTYENTIKKAGIYGAQVATSPLAQGSLVTGLSEELSQQIQLSIENGYDRFLSLVSQGRGLSKAQVDDVAQGRVWLGTQAYEHKLVDELGDFSAAVRKVKALVAAKVKENPPQETDLSLEWFTDQQGGVWQMLLNDFNQGAKATIQEIILDFVGISPKAYGQLKQQSGLLQHYNDPKGQYLYCLNCSVLQ